MFGLLENISFCYSMFFVIGLLFSLRKIYGFLYFLRRIYKPHVSILNVYGVNSYALITGGSDGIGKAFALALAKQGFNLILVARNLEKLELVRNEILQKNAKIQVKIIVFDFKESFNLPLFQEKFAEVKNLDVSILVNNVGIDNLNDFIKTPPEIIKNLLSINMCSTFLLTHLILPQMTQRKIKSAVISLSSMSVTHPLPYFSAYGATKISIDYLMKSLKYEHPNIDWISLKPNFVDTNINNHMKTLQTVDAEGVAEGTLSDLGKYTETYGHWKHEILNTILANVPSGLAVWVFKNIMLKELKGHHDQHRKELEKKNK